MSVTLADRIASWAQKGAKYGDCGRMCDECAFKKGSAANVEEHNVDAAATALAWEATFNCHPQGGNGNAGTVCVGFQYAKQYFENL